MQPTNRNISIKVFISYSHEDKELRQRLEKHLITLRRSEEITIWQDQEILPGANWNSQIKTRLQEADMILLLVSADFLASHYCWEEEVKEAIERHKARTAQVIPIILRPVDWKHSLLGQLQALPTGAKPVTEWSSLDAAFTNVAQGIRKVVEELRSIIRERPPINQNSNHSLPFDHTICKDASLDDINKEVVTSFSQKERVQKQSGFLSNMTNRELLGHFKLLQEEALTYGAVLCFGKNPSEWIAGAFTRCTCWKGNDRLKGWEEDQEFYGSLLEQYESSIGFLQRFQHLSHMASAEESIEQPGIPPVVLREALANALIHREYADQTSWVRVEIFDNRIEISSPGNLPDGLTIQQLGRETDYPIRNPQIARIFYLSNYVERYGTGIARMQLTMEEAGLQEPQFDISDGRTFKVILYRFKRVYPDITIESSLTLEVAKPDQTSELSLSSDRVVTQDTAESVALPDSVNIDNTTEVTPPSISVYSDQRSGISLLLDGVEEHDYKRTDSLLPGAANGDSVAEPSLSSRGGELSPVADPSFSSRVRVFVIKRRYQLLSLVLAIILVIAFFILAFPKIFPSTPMGIGIINEPNNEQIGLSDGTYAFDIGTDRVDASLKKQAAAKLAQGDKVGATSLWNQAVGIDTSDAEALIYLEDERVLASGSPYITLVVATTLTGSPNDISTGRDDLQGAYVEQKEYNDGRKLGGERLIRLLIANAGSKPDYVPEVAGQIVQAARQDSTIVGVMGWSFSAYAQNAISILAGAHIPMVSSAASADSLSGKSPYFFRVAPPNKIQAIAGAKYAEQQLHASRVALFVDPNNLYSNSLANDFEQQFVADGNRIVDTESYAVGDQANLPALLPKALRSNPDLIYFAGYADDLAVLLVNLPTSLPNLQVLGGDGLYAPKAYPPSARPGFSRIRFTAFTYPDEWSILGLNAPQFFSEYPTDFNPTGADHSGNPYGFMRADAVTILAYDAVYALLQGCQNVLDAKFALTPAALQHGLARITGAKAIQGVSGQISFGSNGDPIDKAIVVLYVDQDGHIQMVGVQGCFELGKCG